ncbi:putative multiple sugar transport system ATP-binding protein, partial [Pleomorphomonas diazotrophica]
VLINNVMHNNTLANHKGISKNFVIDEYTERKAANEYRQKLRIRTPSIYQDVVNLSGGNQQKVVLAKWLFANPDVLILDEPTRGIDVGAKYEIYSIVNDLVAAGKAVIFISSEMPELLGTCDRIYVMNEGAIVAEMPVAEASQENIMGAIMRSGEKV